MTVQPNLGVELRTALEDASDDYEARLRAFATVYVRFATRDPGLLELMFAAKHGEQSAALRDAFERVVTVVDGLIRQGQLAGKLQAGDPERGGLLLTATLHGVAALVTSGTVEAGQVDGLIADAVALFTHGPRWSVGHLHRQPTASHPALQPWRSGSTWRPRPG